MPIRYTKSNYNARRTSALSRLEEHLSKHKSFHKDMSDENFTKHDSSQKQELAKLKEIVKS